jgi:predicted ATP-dependent endonuclease of OLD family
MRIECIELQNFRRLDAIRIDFSAEKTLFVGANNSGKTSAMTALRYFLASRSHREFHLNDIPLHHHKCIDEIGSSFEVKDNDNQPYRWSELLPSLDMWLNVSKDDIHHIARLIPTLDWKPENGIGVRLQLEPRKVENTTDGENLKKDYLASREAACKAHESEKEVRPETEESQQKNPSDKFTLWPENLTAFLERKLSKHMEVKAYLLDPSKRKSPENGVAQSQKLSDDEEALDFDPFKGLIKIDEINAQRGFSDNISSQRDGDGTYNDEGGSQGRLSSQLSRYYKDHLNPNIMPDSDELPALRAIHDAQIMFNKQLETSFQTPFRDLEKIGYPGGTNPGITISTNLTPADGLRHSASVEYDVAPVEGSGAASPYRLPEQYNGLGYQNLISMVFRLISFRDSWMKFGKAKHNDEDTDRRMGLTPPLHLVLVEEPEAHLHAQVQQVFIREAYGILRNHDSLRESTTHTTQLVVSTHSSHIAHEVEFAKMRYFRRHPAINGGIPTSTVVNLSEVFGIPNDTAKFVTRYLKATHADLFFADGAILVEGAAERMLVPHFIRNEDDLDNLKSSYITLLEIGGSHAHRFLPLIESLGLNTLIITDLDTAEMKLNEETNKSRWCKAQPKKSADQQTLNTFLKIHHPGEKSVDKLLKLKSHDKEKPYDQFEIRVAYQIPVQVKLHEQSAPEEALSSTFEDALVLENIEQFKGLNGEGLIKKFRKAIEQSASHADLSKALFDELKNGDKGKFALDILWLVDPEELKTPKYIFEGLEWLQNRLKIRQKEVLLQSSTGEDSSREGAE